jgi:hypothetical protein
LPGSGSSFSRSLRTCTSAGRPDTVPSTGASAVPLSPHALTAKATVPIAIVTHNNLRRSTMIIPSQAWNGWDPASTRTGRPSAVDAITGTAIELSRARRRLQMSASDADVSFETSRSRHLGDAYRAVRACSINRVRSSRSPVAWLASRKQRSCSIAEWRGGRLRTAWHWCAATSARTATETAR